MWGHAPPPRICLGSIFFRICHQPFVTSAFRSPPPPALTLQEIAAHEYKFVPNQMFGKQVHVSKNRILQTDDFDEVSVVFCPHESTLSTLWCDSCLCRENLIKIARGSYLTSHKDMYALTVLYVWAVWASAEQTSISLVISRASRAHDLT